MMDYVAADFFTDGCAGHLTTVEVRMGTKQALQLCADEA